MFAHGSCLLELCGCLCGCACWQLPQDSIELLVKEGRDEFGRMQHRPPVLVHDAHGISMTHSLRDHQSVDAVRREIFHVAVEKACTAAAEHSLAIADDGTNRRACAAERPLADARGNGPQVGGDRGRSGAFLAGSG